MPGEATEFAPAKVNLTLHVLGKRPDGYHELESLVVFADADASDRLTLAPGPALELSVTGPTAGVSGPTDDNLVLKAARLLAERVPGLKAGDFTLEKNLPVAAGLGGGSSDAAAALRLLARANGLALDDARLREAARLTGADVPVCLDPRPRIMRGIGEVLSAPLMLPKLPAILINPRVAVPTPAVFKALAAPPLAATVQPDEALSGINDEPALVSALERRRNDLETPAIGIQPVIAEVIAALRASAACHFARMSGSGATCFGLFASAQAAQSAARALRAAHPGWWVQETAFN